MIFGGNDARGVVLVGGYAGQLQAAHVGIVQGIAGGYHGDGIHVVQFDRGHAGILGKAVVHQLDGIGPARVFPREEQNGNQLDPVALRRTHKAVARPAGGACLDADGVGIVILVVLLVALGIEKVVGAGKGAGAHQVGFGGGVAFGRHHLAEGFVLHGLLGDDGHIPCGGKVIVVMQAVGIGKMRGGAAKGHGSLVHQVHKAADRTGYRAGDGVGRVVGRLEQRCVEQVAQGDFLALPQIGSGYAVLVEGDVLRGYGTRLVKVAEHQRQKTCHNLGGGRGVHHRIGVFLKDDKSGAGLNQDGRGSIKLLLLQQFRMLGAVRVGVRGKGGLRNFHGTGAGKAAQHCNHHQQCCNPAEYRYHGQPPLP